MYFLSSRFTPQYIIHGQPGVCPMKYVWFITIFDSFIKGLGDVVAWTAGTVLGDPVGLSQSCVPM